jgi:hypothetical protein
VTSDLAGIAGIEPTTLDFVPEIEVTLNLTTSYILIFPFETFVSKPSLNANSTVFQKAA